MTHGEDKILVVDDDVAFGQRLARSLRRRQKAVWVADATAEAVRLARAVEPAKAVVDLKLGQDSGLELLTQLKGLSPSMHVVILTGYGSIAIAVDATKLGAVNFLQKPADADDIIAAFDRGAQPAAAPAPTSYAPPSLARVEWEHINRVLADCGGNVSEAARRLGMHRRTLQRKLNSYPPNT